MSQFQIHTIDTAPEAAKEALTAVKNANGFIPNLIGVLANAPTALETYRTVGGINGRNSLTATEREVVQITAAVVNGCGRTHQNRIKSVEIRRRIGESNPCNSTH